MLDTDIQFSQLKKLLDYAPNILKDDVDIGVEYETILKLVRRKKLFENAGQVFNPESIHAYYDIDELTKEKQKRVRQSDFGEIEEMYAMEQDSTAVMEDELNVEEQKEKGNLKQEVMS